MQKLIKFFFIFSLSLSAQDKYIKGFVVDNNKERISYFNVVLISVTDSTLIAGNTFENGYFEFLNLPSQKIKLQISSIGYKNFSMIYDLTEHSVDTGTVSLSVDFLDEVIIIAKKPVITRKAGNLIVNVQNSSLSSNVNMLELLRKSPGVLVDKNDVIKIFGKGEPEIYINNKILNNPAELEALQPADIDYIEINRNPSAIYSASANAVLKIYTIKKKTNGINALLYNDFFVGRKANNTIGTRLNMRNGKLSSNLSYSYADKKSLEFSKSFTNTNFENSTQNIDEHATENLYSQTHNVFWGAEYAFNAKNLLGLQFIASDNNLDDFRDSFEHIQSQKEVDRMINSVTGRKSDFYNFNANYSLEIDSIKSLKTNVDFSNNRLYDLSNIEEKNLTVFTSTLTQIENKNKFDVFALRVDYVFSLPKKIKTTLGLKYASVFNKNKTDIRLMSNAKSTISEKVSATYVNFEKKIGKFNINAGLRAEHTDSEIRITDGLTQKIDTVYTDFFPSGLVEYFLSDNFNLSFSYSRKISRPRFDEISSNFTFIDSLSFSVGNPKIRPTKIDNFEVSSIFGDFSISIDFSNFNDSRQQTAVADQTNPSITKYTYQNFDGNEFSVNIDYTYTGKWYSAYVNFGYSKPSFKIPFLNKTRKINSPMWLFSVNNEFNIRKNLLAFINIEYESAGDIGITSWKSSYEVSGGIQYHFFDKKLQFSFSVNDMFKTQTYDWTDRFDNINSGEQINKDSRKFLFSLKYNLNDFKTLIRKKSINDDELERM